MAHLSLHIFYQNREELVDRLEEAIVEKLEWDEIITLNKNMTRQIKFYKSIEKDIERAEKNYENDLH